jgi:helix-hairpin-helix protein/AAA domain-containing protein
MPSMTSPTSDPAPAELFALFAQAGVPEPYARRAAHRLGPGAADALRADPWRLLRVPGVRPDQADHFARRLLGEAAEPGDPRRGRALVVHVLTGAARHGHTALPPKTVLGALRELRVAEPERAVEAALDEADVVALLEEPEFDPEDPDEVPEPEELLGLARYALAEEAAAEGLQRLTATAGTLLEPQALKPLRAGLPEDRQLAMTAAVRTGVSVLHGSAGDVAETLAALTEILGGQGVRTAVAGPGAGLAGLLAGHGEERPLELDLLLVPDAMGLDVELAGTLVEACADGTHLVLAGDPAELPPAGPGRVLADLAASETVPVVELEPSGAGGPLAEFTAAVRRGELPAVDAPGREVVVVPVTAEAEAVHRAVQLVTDSIPRALGIPAGQVLVVAPAAGGQAGAGALNAALKARLNPGPGAYGGFDPGDRVIVAAPLPGVAAGELGTVGGATAAGLEIAFGHRDPVLVPPDRVTALRHGWAATAGQARGNRRPAVVAVLAGESADRLSRALAVTAFGLAERHLSVVHGAGAALARAVREDGRPARETRLERLLRG